MEQHKTSDDSASRSSIHRLFYLPKVQRKVRHMAGETDAEAQEEITVDPNSQLVELVPGCNDDAVDITVLAGGGEDHVQDDTLSEDDISVLGENKHRKRSRPKAKKRDHIISEAKAPKL